MYERTIAEYKKEGVDLEPFLDNLEAKFIEEGILSGQGGLAKVKYFERLAAGKPVHRSLRPTGPSEAECDLR